MRAVKNPGKKLDLATYRIETGPTGFSRVIVADSARGCSMSLLSFQLCHQLLHREWLGKEDRVGLEAVDDVVG